MLDNGAPTRGRFHTEQAAQEWINARLDRIIETSSRSSAYSSRAQARILASPLAYHPYTTDR